MWDVYKKVNLFSLKLDIYGIHGSMIVRSVNSYLFWQTNMQHIMFVYLYEDNIISLILFQYDNNFKQSLHLSILNRNPEG